MCHADTEGGDEFEGLRFHLGGHGGVEEGVAAGFVVGDGI